MEAWKPTDVVAIASLIGGIFGRGGGNELNSALTMQAFVERFGAKAGRSAWLGFRSKNDPEAPTTISKRFPYETRSAFAKRGLALPDPGSVRETPVATASSGAPGGTGGFGATIERALSEGAHASNWELVSAKHSATGHPIAVMGPQVGYFIPQILMEEDLHGPGIDARGASFAGVNLAVELGHGRDYAWSATSAGLRQRRHVRRGSLQGQVPLPLPRQVQADGKAGKDRELDAERDRLDRSGVADADRHTAPCTASSSPAARSAAERWPSSTSAAPTSTSPTR